MIAPDMFGGVVVDPVEAAEQEAGRHDKGFAETFAVVRAGAERVVRDRGEIGRGIGVVAFIGAAYALELVADPTAGRVDRRRRSTSAIGVVGIRVRRRGAAHALGAFLRRSSGHFASADRFA